MDTQPGTQNSPPGGMNSELFPITFNPSTPPSVDSFLAGIRPLPLTLEKRGTSARMFQPKLAVDLVALRNTVTLKLRLNGKHDLANKLDSCHTYQTVRECMGCKDAKIFWNRCENFACCICQPRLSRDREKAVKWWVADIKQPKHVVLTIRNTDILRRPYIAAFKKAWKSLRTSAFAENWNGGFWSLEITNEGKGWHLHMHALIDARWIDAVELAKQWGKRIGQEFGIVKVVDCRAVDYLSEVTKYTVKGTTLAGWTPEEIGQYVTAFEGVRTFGTFGTLYDRRAEYQKWLESLQAVGQTCTCGCTSFRYLDYRDWECRGHDPGAKRVPEPAENPQPSLGFLKID